MPADDVSAAKEWLAAYLDMTMPGDQLAGMVATTRRVAASLSAETGALAMEDEPAGFLVRLGKLA
jgi:hypothetical protein